MTDVSTLTQSLQALAIDQQKLADAANALSEQVQNFATSQTVGTDHSFFITGLTVFILACFVGYYVVWHVTPALHSPLMAVTNAISSVIIVGALVASGMDGFTTSSLMGLGATLLASINIFGGFIVTQRMLQMYKKKGK